MHPLLSRDFKYKVFSFVLAVVIWVYVSMEIVQTDFFYDKIRGNVKMVFKNIPIKILDLPNDGSRSMVLNPETVAIVLSLPKNLEKIVTSKDIIPYVSQDFLLDGTYETLIHFILPKGGTLLSPEKSVQLIMKTIEKKKNI